MVKYFLVLSVPLYYVIVSIVFVLAFVDLKYSMLECEVQVTSILGGVLFAVLSTPIITIIPAYVMYKKTKNR